MNNREKYNRFARGSGVYVCRSCGKKTRQVSRDSANVGLCQKCFEEAGWENEHSDRGHTKHPDPNCPICKKMGLVNPMLNVHPEAIESLKQYKEDLKAGHKSGAEYWRGAAGAYFTANPKTIVECPKCQKRMGVYNTVKRYDLKGGAVYRCPKCGYEFWRDFEKNPLLSTLITGATLGAGVTAGYLGVKKLLKKNPGEQWHLDRFKKLVRKYSQSEKDDERKELWVKMGEAEFQAIMAGASQIAIRTIYDEYAPDLKFFPPRNNPFPVLPTLITGATLGAGATAGYLGVKKLMKKENPILPEIGAGIITGLGIGTGWNIASHGWDKIVKKNPEMNEKETKMEKIRRIRDEIRERRKAIIELSPEVIERMTNRLNQLRRYDKQSLLQEITRVTSISSVDMSTPKATLISMIMESEFSEQYMRSFSAIVKPKKNPFPVKMQSTRIIKGKKYFYAGRTLFFDKAGVELQQLVEKGIGGAVTKREGQYLLWTREPVWVDLAEPLSNPVRH